MKATQKNLIGLSWIDIDKTFIHQTTGEPVRNLVPVGEPRTVSRNNLRQMAKDIGRNAPEQAEAYCIGWESSRSTAPIQYFSLAKR